MKPPFAALLLMLGCASVQAQTAVPGAGSILQQVQPTLPPAPSSTGTGLTIEKESGGQLPPSAPFEVRTIRITGNTVFDTATLHALVADAEGKRLTLPELGKAAARITDHYRRHGYPLARAIIPAQTIESGAVRIEVIEARYGRIGLDNRSPVSESLLQPTLSPLQVGQVISQPELDRSLLLLSDVPGVAVNATLRPGEAVGTSDLLINAGPGPSFSGNAVLDNYGSRHTGRARLGGTANFINPLHHGDMLSAGILSSGGGLNYGRLGYDTLLTGQGTRLGGSYSALQYRLGGELSPLQAHGTAQVASLWARHPLLRGRTANLYGQIQYGRTQLRDHIDATEIRADRHLDDWTLGLSGDANDAFLSGATNTWSLGWTLGKVRFDDETARRADAVTVRTQGAFSKWIGSFSRIQSLDMRNALQLVIAGQWANANLDPSQKMAVGGPYAVRAYDIGAILGDTGYRSALEWRHDLDFSSFGRWQTVAFLDHAHARINKTTWTAGANSATLSAAGAGLNWTGPDQWGARAYVATPIGPAPALALGERSTRAWIEIGKAF